MAGSKHGWRRCACLVVAAAATIAAAPATAQAAPPLELAACSSPARTLPEQTESALEATLLLRSGEGVGSAVLISADGFALTAAHVVAGTSPIEATTFSGQRVPAERVRIAPNHDVALIKIDPEAVDSCLALSQAPPKIGGDVYVLGSPGGEALSFSVSKGIVSGHRRFADTPFLQLDASVNPGNSGGPVVDAQGRVIGIASWKIADVHFEGLSFAVPTGVARTRLGLSFGAVTDPDWREAAGVVDVSAKRTHATRPHAPTADVSADVRRRLRIREGLLVGGGVVLGTGVTLLVSGGSARAVRDGGGTARQRRMVAQTMAAGWVFCATGAVAITAGLFVRRNRPAPERSNAPTAAFRIAPTRRGLVLSGTF